MPKPLEPLVRGKGGREEMYEEARQNKYKSLSKASKRASTVAGFIFCRYEAEILNHRQFPFVVGTSP